MRKFSVLKMACIVLAFLAANAIASPAQTFTALVNFDGPNGAGPAAPLIQGTDGNFYGITGSGGANNCNPIGCGTVFQMTPTGTLTTLHSFDGTDGATLYYPYGGLVEGSDGNFYGTTSAGGASSNCALGCGTVFKINPVHPYTLAPQLCWIPD